MSDDGIAITICRLFPFTARLSVASRARPIYALNCVLTLAAAHITRIGMPVRCMSRTILSLVRGRRICIFPRRQKGEGISAKAITKQADGSQIC